MKIINFKSEPPVSPFAPEWNWFMGEDQLENIDFNRIAEIILQKENEIIEAYPVSAKGSVDAYTGLGENSLSSRYEDFNLFEWDYPEIKQLFEEVKRIHEKFIACFGIPKQKVWIQCWANVLRTGQHIAPHLHSTQKYSYLGGHITVKCDKTATVYINPINQINEPQEYHSENEVGKITLFQNNIPHYTTKHNGDSERISIAFDIIIDADPNKPKKAILLDE